MEEERREPTDEKERRIGDILYPLALASQVGFAIAGPVLVGLLAGWWLDGRLDTGWPIMTALLTLAGMVIGPIVAYRWVMAAMEQWRKDREKEDS
ncbi:MAG: hypothetical protein MAG451_02788 [Anaerolineales bacterium]|nr:hypothetical protein [Anaerolineales bacterium]